MRLSWVELRDYRNHAHTRIELRTDGLFVVAGPNGEGKTNLLEAMHFLYALGSPRVGASAPLVREGAVRHVAASNYTAPRLAEALRASDRGGLARYVALQPEYNLVSRDEYEGD